MSLKEMERTEKIILLIGLLIVITVFSISIYDYFFPKEQVWEAKVFQVFHNNEKTTIYSYGNGKLKLLGNYDIEIDATYRITYKSRKRNTAEFDIHIEKISG
jgi:hypothetical protein